MRTIEVYPLTDSEHGNESYDIFVAAVGFEERCRFLPLRFAGRCQRKLASTFGDRRDLAYEKNRQECAAAGFEILDLDDQGYRARIKSEFESVRRRRSRSTLRVAIDVSSQTRLRIAELLWALASISGRQDVLVDVLYAPARYSPAPKVNVLERFGPVIPELCGWATEPRLPVLTIIGLGYEAELALGVTQTLPGAPPWLFAPENSDPRYRYDVEQANESLLSQVPGARRQSYRIDRPLETHALVGSLCDYVAPTSRVIIVPMGPKLFAAIAIVVALTRAPAVGVWRVTAGRLVEPTNRIPDGTVAAFRLILSARGIAGANR